MGENGFYDSPRLVDPVNGRLCWRIQREGSDLMGSARGFFYSRRTRSRWLAKRPLILRFDDCLSRTAANSIDVEQAVGSYSPPWKDFIELR
jgi:hypothetical protein